MGTIENSYSQGLAHRMITMDVLDWLGSARRWRLAALGWNIFPAPLMRRHTTFTKTPYYPQSRSGEGAADSNPDSCC